MKQRKPRPVPYDGSPPLNLKLMTSSERGKYYRRRRKLYGAELERRVADPREEIAALTVSRQVQHELAVSQRRTPLGAAAHIVNEYCLLFSHGAPVRLAVDEQLASASLVAQSTNAQRGFLNAVMKGNVRFGEFLGVGLLLDQWERYSLYHAAIDWTMKTLNIVQLAEPSNNQYEEGPLVVSITADLRVRYSRRTIEEVFPHLIGDVELIQSLIGLEVTYPSVNHFHFGKDGKIEWYAPEANFVGALMNVLKNPMLVARVMRPALVSKGRMIGDKSDGRQLAVVELASAPTTVGSDRVSVMPVEDAVDAECQHCTTHDVAIVSDDDPFPESPPCQLSKLRIAHILDE